MSILSTAIQQKKKKNAGEAAPSPATTNKQRTILASAIQAKKNGTIFSAPTVNPAAIRSYNAYKASVPQITTGIAGNDSWKRPNDVSDFDYSGNDLALDNTTDYNRLAELKIAADREAERNKYAVSALGGGGKSTAAKIAYETYLAEHTIPSEQEKVYTSEDSLVYQMLKDRAEAEKRQQSLPGTQRVQGLDPSKMGSLSGFADAFKSVSGTHAQDSFDDFRRRNIDYNSYLNAADFEEYSKKGAEIQNPTFEEAQGGANIFGWRPGSSDVGNIVTFSRDNLDKIQERMASDDRSQFVGNALYGEMTEDQVKIYNYILAKEGKEAAQIYLDSIADTLNEEYGKKVAATVESTRGTALHPIMVAGTATSAGLDQYIGGVKQAFNEYEQPTSGIQYAGQAVRENQGAIGKFAYDAISTLSNMAPSILASYVAMGLGVPAKAAEWVAAGSIGLGSGGNAYKQALAEGRSRDEAKNVAVLTGASEAVLSKLLSGISAVGGLAPKKLLPKVAAIEKGIWRVAAAAGIKLGGEISEEVMQLYLEPLYKTLIYGDQYDAPTVEEVAYTALLTLVTTGLVEGGEIAKYRTKEGAAEAVRAELQEDAQSVPVGVSDGGNAPGGGQAQNAPATTQTEQTAPQTEQKKATVGLRDPMQVLMEENRKAQAQQNEKTAAETQRNVFESNTEKKAPGFYSNDRFTGTNEEAQYLDRLAKAAGVSIEMSATKDGRNGWIVNGEAHLSENANDPLRVVAKHEITHHLQDAAGEAYGQFRNYVENIYRSRGTLDQQIAAIQNLYRENGEELTWDGAMDELAADYAGELLDNEVLIRKLAGENRNLAQRILDGIRDLIRRVKTAFGDEEVKQLDRAARLWENALRETNEAYQRGEVAANPATRYSMAGVNAKTADLDALSRAEEMERRGVDEETIFRDTGWIRGADQKWRFEIDDSGMKYHRGGDAYFRRRYPEYNEFRELGVRQLYELGTESWTEQDQNRLLQLNEIWRNEPGRLSKILSDGNANLRDIVEHTALFEAYPELEDVKVKFGELDAGEKGHYNRSRNEIVLSESLKGAPEATLLHEIQHAIQQIEGFPGGASPEFWQQKISNGFEQRRNDRRIQAADAEYRSIFDNASDEFKNKVRAINRATLAKDYDTVMALEDEIYEGEYADLYSKLSMADFVRRGERGAVMTAEDLYENTAGEIEARETARRRKMTTDQRKESVPFRGDENTVFADGTSYASSQVLGGFADIEVIRQKEVDSFNIKSFNDYVGVQKTVFKTLQSEGFFDPQTNSRTVENADTGLVVEINKSGIDETFGPGDRYARQPREVKELKLATVRYLPEIIEYGEVVDKNNRNYHNDNSGLKYSYIEHPVQVDGKTYLVTVDIRQSQQKNKFWMHKVEINENGQSLMVSAANAVKYPNEELPNDNVSQERRSVKGSRDLQKQIDALERQNKRLKEQMKRTDVPKVRREVVRRSAKDLRSMYSSKIDLDVLTDRIENVYNQLAKLSGAGNLQELDGIPSWDEVRSEMRSIADAILAESRGNVNPMTEEYGEIRKELRGRKISIADEYRADLESAGGYEGIRKQNFGTFSLSKDGAPIDTVYDELNEKYPTLFPDDIVHPADQLIRLSDVLEDLKAVEGNPFENDLDTTAQYLAGEIEERFYDTPDQKPTLADKMASTYHKQRLKDQKELRAKLADQKRTYEKQVEGIHKQYAKQNQQRIENQNAAQRRETIYRRANRLANKLLRPTNKQHVPEELRGAAYNLLKYINLESGYELSYGKGATYRRVMKGTELDAEPNSRTLAAIELKKKLEEMAGKENMTIDPDMGDYLSEIALMGNKTLQQMTRAELDTVWKVMQIVEHTINRANELHEQGRYDSLSAMATALATANKDKRDRKDYVKAVGALDKLVNFDMLSPETFFHKLGKPGDEIYRMMRRAADRQTGIYNEGVSKAQKLIEESGADFTKLDKEFHEFDFGGKRKITLSKSQIMELYALSRREQARDHIEKGGLKAVGAAKGLVEQSNVQPVKVSWAEVEQITSKLTDKEKKLVEGLQAYLSNELSKHGNEETMKVYGYEKFKEKFYWPIKVSGTETESSPSKAAHAKTIPGYGMTKNVEPDASNAVELHSAIDTFSNHLNQMATYAAWLGTNEDITRLINFQYDSVENGTENTVKRILATVYGKNGEKYINDLLSDIAQGTKAGQDRTLSDNLTSQWKAAKVGGNLRVIVQQPTAILRAMTMLDPKYMVAGANAKTGWEKAKKYAPIAQWKDWGYFEIGTGRSLREQIVGAESGIDKVKNSLMWAAGAMDSVSWGYLWNAVERETADRKPNLAKGSEDFYKAVADRFSEIVDRTQVVDSVLHRTQIMRSGNALNKMATSFMSEPSKIYNMVARDLYDIVDADSETAKKRAYKALRRSSGALIASFAVNALMQSLVDALRDDDRDKGYWEKFAENYFGITGDEESFAEYYKNFWSGNFWQNFNPLSYIPYVKDVLSIAQGYEVDRSDMAAISDLANALQQLGKSISGEGQKGLLATGMDAAAKLGDLVGIPVSNVKRDVAAAITTVLNGLELYEVQYALDKIVYNEEKASGVFFGDLYRTMNNDYEAYEDIYEDMYEGMIERGYEKDEAADKISDAMENKMKNDLGVESVKSMPVRYSSPTTADKEDPFYALLKKARENDTNWIEALDPGSIEIALAVDSIRDAKTLEKIRMVAEQPYGEDLKRLAMRNFMGDSQWGRYLSALNAGVSSKQFAEFLEAIAKEAQRRTGKEDANPSQADILAVLEKSKLNSKQKRAIWNGYGWKAESPW